MLAARPVCIALLATAACGETSQPSPATEERREPVERALVHASQWALAAEEDDPLPEHRPSHVECSPQPWHLVADAIEIDTGQCNYVTLVAPLRAPIDEGETLAVDLWWSTLASVEPAHGHIALLVGGQLAWETEVEIPGPADVRHFEIPASFDAWPGEDVTFHLHNHGFNTWTLGRFAVLDDRD